MVGMQHTATSQMDDFPQRLRLLMLAGILLNLALIGGQLLRYPPLLVQPNALTYVAEPVVGLAVYVAVTLGVTNRAGSARRLALRIGSTIGVAGGILFVINLASETFLDLPAPASLFATAPFFLGTFALWGVAGYRSARQTHSVPLGILTAIWSAMCTIVITLTFGFTLSYIALPRLQQILATSPEYARSHWTDLHAFAIANQFDSAFSHLLAAAIIAGILGTLGSLICAAVARRSAQAEQP
jgi:predicted benzoate:H+ symporter BenE